MACYHPMTAYRSRSGRSPNGSWPITFSINEGYKDLKVIIPCGHCIGCRLELSRQWAIRCMMEAKEHDENCFVTLTYNNENLPEDMSVDKREVQLFMKKLRKKLFKEKGIRIRHFLCGEYGDKFSRPHYHLCIFGYDFPDKILLERGEDYIICQSEELENIWRKGFCVVGALTFESAAYVARYVTKKVNGPQEESHYRGRKKEFALMSKKPGLGKKWLSEYKQDVLSVDSVIMRSNLRVRPPKYFDNMIKEEDPELYQKIKSERRRKIKPEENTPERLRAKEHCKELKFKKLKRSYEDA